MAIVFILVGIILVISSQAYNIKDNNISDSLDEVFTLQESGFETNNQNADDAAVSNQSLKIDWVKLLKTNPDVIAWIKIPGVKISQPVLKGASNNEYLRRNIYHNYSRNGCIFVSENTNKPFNQVNTVIYGHNLNNGRMFSNLKKYSDIEFWEKNSYIYIYFPNETMKIYKIISFHTVDVGDKNIYGTNFTSFKDYEPYINQNNVYLDVVKDYNLDNINGVITLSTCTNWDSNERYVIHAICED